MIFQTSEINQQNICLELDLHTILIYLSILLIQGFAEYNLSFNNFTLI